MTRARLIGSAVKRVEDRVIAVFTGADVNTRINPLPGASNIEGANNPKRTILADGIARLFMDEAAKDGAPLVHANGASASR